MADQQYTCRSGHVTFLPPHGIVFYRGLYTVQACGFGIDRNLIEGENLITRVIVQARLHGGIQVLVSFKQKTLFHPCTHFYENAFIFMTIKFFAFLAKLPSPNRKCRPERTSPSPFYPLFTLVSSSAGTNLKVGAPVRRKSGGHRNTFCWSYPSTFFVSKSTISRFGARFRDGPYSLVSFLFAVILLTVPGPRDQTLVKVGGHVPPCSMESAPLLVSAAGYERRRPTDNALMYALRRTLV